MNEINVKAAAGVRVPREDNARRYITATDVVTVPNTAYYQRQISAGDLVVVDSSNKATKAEVKRGQS